MPLKADICRFMSNVIDQITLYNLNSYEYKFKRFTNKSLFAEYYTAGLIKRCINRYLQKKR